MDWNSLVANSFHAAFGVNAIAYAIAAIGLNIHFGYTGLLNFGQAGFLAVGAYGTAISIVHFDVPYFLAALIGMSMAVLLALLLGLPTLRLRADYLAVATIAAAEIVRLVIGSTVYARWTGGSSGFSGAFSNAFYNANPLPNETLHFGPVSVTPNRAWFMIVGWSLVAVIALLVWLLVRSPWGRILKGIREDEDAVRSLGKNVFARKMQALIIGGVIGSIAGIALVTGERAVLPNVFGTQLTFFFWTLLLLGGVARVLGPVLGAVILWLVFAVTESILRSGASAGWVPEALVSQSQIGLIRVMLVGLGLMLLMIFRPQGIVGDRRELAFDVR
ncbi:branched-chain amino acid ABC transporter permease [Phytoactinopolyspora alkaliphila]|uniref:Branched-chain amino acid ABC transporter permease n=1 Tax=Phytoactinopolyspora alkaliphila TaxID=1783498 RepID=A0A6N9YG26_9ACTN|nr:branched-chain amino acid ABC transporter permease [Phytoactinopolyspora alkaliphila]NED93877.1 branched-chain amino acid ABC transporter permease [Phytoactinopolyspora alkaliphila]